MFQKELAPLVMLKLLICISIFTIFTAESQDTMKRQLPTHEAASRGMGIDPQCI